ncbi:MAG: GspH/FimT family pseudopilin [Nitrospiria bacterium]
MRIDTSEKAMSSEKIVSGPIKMIKKTIHNRRGFTAVELLVSVSIVGIMSTLAMPSINNAVLQYRLKSTAREIASSLHLLRLRAISTNAKTYLDFNPVSGLNDRFYTAFVDADSENDHDAHAETEATQLRFSDTLGGYKGTRLPNGVYYRTPDGKGSPVTFAGEKAGFNTNGMPNSSGMVYLTNSLGDAYRVKVATITGRIKIEKWDGSNWN